MNDMELTDIIRSCGGPYHRDMMRGRFADRHRMIVSWRKTTDYYGEDGMDFVFPSVFSDAPISVIQDIVKAIIQEVCYSSERELSDDTKQWINDARCRQEQAMEV